jgi:hypothetical protein
MFGNFFFENRALYEIMWKHFVERRRPQMTIWRMRIACYITKATNTRSKNVIIKTFPLQQWLQVRYSLLRSTHIARLVLSIPVSFCTADVHKT